eukprot:g5030.t1
MIKCTVPCSQGCYLFLFTRLTRQNRIATHEKHRKTLIRPRIPRKALATDQGLKQEEEERLLKVMRDRVEDAAKLLDDIIDDIVCDLSAVQAMGYVYQETPEATEQQIIKKVVKSFLKRLDQNFLASLEKFEQKAMDMGNKDVSVLISKINKEVMNQVRDEFPPEVLLLEDLMKMPDKKDRIDKMKEAYHKMPASAQKCSCCTREDLDFFEELDTIDFEETTIQRMDLKEELERLKILKSETGLKALKEELLEEQWTNESTSDFDDVINSMEKDPLGDCLGSEKDDKESIRTDYGTSICPVKLFVAANQFINDMEEKEVVADRRLLARLCVIREEARLVELEMRYQGIELPENPLKLRENVPSQAMGVIQACVKSGDTIARVGQIRKAFEKDLYGPSEKNMDRAPGYVRPGMFMTALTMAQMEADMNSKKKSTESQYTPEFLQRLDDIRLEALLVLKDMGWGEFKSNELAQRQKEKERMMTSPQ